jgi:hypothetical protein
MAAPTTAQAKVLFEILVISEQSPAAHYLLVVSLRRASGMVKQ